MSDAFSGFESRLKKLDQKRTRLAHGYQSKVGKDGLIVFKPKRRQGGFPLRALVLLIVGFFVFKGLIMAHLGTAIYEERVAALGQGSMVEQAGAFVMQGDPVTESIARKVRPFLN